MMTGGNKDAKEGKSLKRDFPFYLFFVKAHS
jgi:hypothetical protein